MVRFDSVFEMKIPISVDDRVDIVKRCIAPAVFKMGAFEIGNADGDGEGGGDGLQRLVQARCDLLTPAELSQWCNNATMEALRADLDAVVVTPQCFDMNSRRDGDAIN